MADNAVRQKLIAALPEWRSADIIRIERGQTKDSYRLTSGQSQALIKLDHANRDAFVSTRLEEARIQTEAATRGLAPRVLFADADCIVTEYRAGRPFSIEALRQHSVLKEIAALLRQVHALPRSTLDSDMLSAARGYAALIGDSSMVTRCLEAVTNAPTDTPVLCHNDAVLGNLMDGDGVFLIDWEYARNHSPLFDLATVIAHHELSEDQVAVLLNAYDSSGVCLNQLRRYVSAYHGLHWLWLASREPQHARLASIARNIQT